MKEKYDEIIYDSKVKKPKLFDSVDHSESSEAEVVEETEKSEEKEKE